MSETAATTTPAVAVMNNYGQRNLQLVRGNGVYLYDESGRDYLDMTAGIAVCALGHAHPELVEVIRNQAETLLHCSNLYLNPWQMKLASDLTRLSGLSQAFFCNSGTEANEGAIKLARKYAFERGEPERVEIVSLPGGFHGRTLGSLSITPKAQYQRGFGPLVPGCVTPETVEGATDVITEKTAACIVEIVQGEGGVQEVPLQVLLGIQEKCKEVGALFIIDEVQTGIGRTGNFFAFQEIGLSPDVITLAKGLGGGVPIGAVVAREEVAAAFSPGTHGTTFGGNPLATAVGQRICEIVSQPAFLENVREVASYLRSALWEFGEEVTGKGLMLGVTVPDAKEFVQNAMNRGVLLTAVGPTRVRFVPPLILTRADVDEMCRRLSTDQ